jgi:hypothetical protein
MVWADGGLIAPDEATVLAARWPNDFVCPRCEGATCRRFERHGHANWSCKGVPPPMQPAGGYRVRQHQVAADAVDPGAVRAIQTKNDVSALELMRHLGVCCRTVWQMKHKLMQAILHQDAARQLSGFVQIDDGEKVS